MAVPVAIVGLTAAYRWPAFAMPVAIAMVALAIYLPGVAIAAAFVVVLLTLLWLWVKGALRNGTVLGKTMSPADGMYAGYGLDAGGWCDSGGADGGGCDAGGL